MNTAVNTLARMLLVALLASTLSAPAQAAPASFQDETDAPAQIEEITAAAPTVHDSFRSDSGQWDTESDDDVSRTLRGGALHILVNAESILGWSSGPGRYADFYVTADAVHVSGPLDNEFGLLFRYVDEGNFYFFAASSDGFYLLNKLVGGEWQTVVDWTASELIVQGEGEANSLGVLARGDEFTLFINGAPVQTVNDDEFADGGVALAVGSFDEAGIGIAFDDFSLWNLGGDLPLQQEPPVAEETPEQPTPSPEIDLAALAARVAEIIAGPPAYSEDFRRQSGAWITSDDENARIFTRGRTYRVAVDAAEWMSWGSSSDLDALLPADFYVEVEMTYVSGPPEAEAGILFRLADQENFYFYAVSGLGSYSLWRYVEGRWDALIPWTESDLLVMDGDAPNLLGLYASGDAIGLFANGEALAAARDDTFEAGALALAVGTFSEGGVEVAFDNIALWPLEADAQPPLSTPVASETPVEQEPTPEPTPQPDVTPAPTPAVDAEAVLARRAEVTAGQAAVNDTFSRDRGGWTTESDGYATYAYADRALRIQVDSRDWISWSLSERSVGDFAAEVDVEFGAAPGDMQAGLIFRLVDSDNFYLFSVSPQGTYSLWKKAAGEWTALLQWTPSEALERGEGAHNRLGVLAEGATISLWANETILASVEDDTLAEGVLALAVGSFEAPGVAASFDNLEVWDISPD